MKAPKDANTSVASANKSLDTTATSQPAQQEAFGEGQLDSELSIIKKATISVKAGNVQAAFVQNLDAIQESVNNFQKMKEDAGNDIIAQFQAQKEQYESQIAKLTSRVAKQESQRDELSKLATQLNEDVE